MRYLKIPQILLPKKNIDYEKWAVIACDQFTSQLSYWEELKNHIKDSKSTLNLIMPEVYLGKIDQDKKVHEINQTMEEYLNDDVFYEFEDFVYVEREIAPNVVRKGILIAVDLEEYDYSKNGKLPIRATEKTVEERLPIRIQIRKDAKIELPHICLFMDDKEDKVFKELEKNKTCYEKLYDFDLNMNGGHIEGYRVSDSEKIANMIIDTKSNNGDILFVVGDGNHSLATAKECWKLIKKNLTEEEQKNHPARYALCELQNIHDKSMKFEPIHRFILNGDENLVEYLKTKLKGDGELSLLLKDEFIKIPVSSDPTNAIADIQSALDEYMSNNKYLEIDYIHGDEHLKEVSKNENGLAIFMPAIDKSTLFSYVSKNGVMPRKSFSIGHAENKRYYIEARKVK